MSAGQIELTVENVHPATLRYSPVEDAAPWQIEDWRSLTTAFSLAQKDVVDWHIALAGQGRPWEIVRRLYQIGPLYGEESTKDDEKQWTFEELSQKWSLPVKSLKADHDALVQFWKRTKETVDLKERLNVQSSGLPEFESTPPIEDEKILPLLEKYRFDYLPDSKERQRVARRIMELKSQLETPAYRETARQIIAMEGSMGSYERQLYTTQRQIDDLSAKDTDIIKELKKIGELEDRFDRIQKALTLLTQKHRELLAEIGAETEEFDAQKTIAIDSFSYGTEAMIRYYQREDRSLIDGMHTAAEILFLLTPTDVRDFQQYRPDVATRVKEALIPANLWRDDYKPTVIQRDACRLLKRICDGLFEEPASSVEPEIDSAVASDDGIDLEETPMHPSSEAPAEYQAPEPFIPSRVDEQDFVVATED